MYDKFIIKILSIYEQSSVEVSRDYRIINFETKTKKNLNIMLKTQTNYHWYIFYPDFLVVFRN